MSTQYQKLTKVIERFSSQWLVESATEEINDAFSAKHAQLQRLNHRLTDANCSKSRGLTHLLPSMFKHDSWHNTCCSGKSMLKMSSKIAITMLLCIALLPVLNILVTCFSPMPLLQVPEDKTKGLLQAPYISGTYTVVTCSIIKVAKENNSLLIVKFI